MASTYSPNLALTLIGTGDQAGAWGNTTNVNLGTLLEQAISGYVTQAITDGADTVITIPNGATGVARNMYIECTGAITAARNLLVPSNKKLYFIYNNTTGGFAVTVKVAGQTGVSVPNGKKMALVCNGTDIVDATNYLSGTATNVTGTVAITNGGTGLTATPSNGQLLIGNGTGFSLANIQAGANVTVTNSAGGITISASGGGGGGGGVSGVTASAPLASSGGAVPDISLTGTVPVANGGTGATTLTGYVKGNGTSAMTAAATIPGTDISGNITGNAGNVTGTVAASNGGTGNTSYTQGQVLIGNSAGGLTKNTLTAGSNITITNGDGNITIAATGSAGGVTSFSAGSTGFTPSTATTGAVTLGGTLGVGYGGTGSTTASGARTSLGLAIGTDIPSLTGTGASGTWSISINGNAATATTASTISSTLPINKGGTATTTTPSNGQLLIGNGSGYSVANLTAGSNITITNSAGGISIAATGGSGTVTSVGGTGTVNGITLTGTVTSSGNLTLGGSLSGVSLTSQVSGTLPIANGGTGQITQQAAINALAGSTTSGYYLRGNGSNITMAPIQSGDVPTAFLRYSSSGSALVTASTSSPTGGSDGDIWLKY